MGFNEIAVEQKYIVSSKRVMYLIINLWSNFGTLSKGRKWPLIFNVNKKNWEVFIKEH